MKLKNDMTEKSNHIPSEKNKKRLIQFLVDVQKKILEQEKGLKDLRYKEKKNQKGNFLFLIEVLENFSTLQSAISAKENIFDKTNLKILRSYDMIHRKISNYLEGQGVQKINFHDNMPRIEYCKVIESEEVDNPSLKGKIKDIVSHGYTCSDKVLKYAQVITYR